MAPDDPICSSATDNDPDRQPDHAGTDASASGAEAYEIGYGKPPVSTRFKRGRSGNPAGRKKGVRNYNSEIDEVLRTPIGVTGKARPVTLREAILRKQAQRAVKDGDPRAAKLLLGLADAQQDREEARAAERQSAAVSAEDAALIAAALARLTPEPVEE